jgi:hypothetical protein
MTDEDLVGRFADLTDDALVARIQSGDLSESARAIARAEAERRGLDVSAESSAEIAEVDLPSPSYVQLSGFLEPMEAYVMEGRLKAEGIDVHLMGAGTLETNPLWLNAMGGVRLFVPRFQYERAKEIIARQDEGEYALTDDASAADEDNAADEGKQRFGWVVLMLPSLAFAAVVLYQIWKSECEPNTYCAIQEQQQSVGFYLIKLLGSAIAIAPAAWAIRYLSLRFRRSA